MCDFLGYSGTCEGYKYMNLNTEQVHVAPNVIFNEAKFPFKNIEQHSSPNTSPLTSTLIISFSPFVQIPSLGPRLDAIISNNVLRTPTTSSPIARTESNELHCP